MLRRPLLPALGTAIAGAAIVAASLPAAAPATAAGVSDTATPAALAPFYSQTLEWSGCQSSLSCTWLTVPLDYADPTGPTIRIRVAKANARGQSQGAIVVNPGGPGASGLEFAASIMTSLSSTVRARYDVVGFDPRGVGKSAPIICMTGVQTTRWLALDPSPDTKAEEQALMRGAAQIPRGCLRRSPEIARHVGSEDTVRDMDVLRAALGNDRLNWLGFSYGTYLGTMYAEEFPDRVGRMVLDGALDPSLDLMQISHGQSHGFQTAMTRFAADCIQHTNCPTQESEQAVLNGINRLLVRLDRAPMKSDHTLPLLESQAISALFYAMYSPDLWPLLRYGLKQASVGDGAGLQALSDYANDKTGPTTYGSNMASAFPAISCWDAPAPPGQDGLRKAANAWSRGVAVPDMARAMSWGNAPCSQWYGHSDQAPAAAHSTTTSPILIIGTTYDPATPYWWAQALSRQLPTSGLLTYRGDGHTAFGRGTACVDSAVNTYLLDGTLPPSGTVCG
jgi:pimeloyl-ACP methyl ester carboxylesterase